MVDYHSHILPKADHGSQSVRESLQMLQMLKEQKVDAVFATPHYYAEWNSPEEFLERRQSAYESLREHLTPDLPKLLLGAEIEYFDGISRSRSIYKLKLQSTRILLIEMPAERWSMRWVSELLEMNESSGYTVMIAHVERCIFYQKKSVVKRLLDSGIIMQVTTTFFTNPDTRKKALKMLKKGQLHALGSDAHNADSRPPNMGDAMAVIAEHLGEDGLRRLEI